MRRSATAVATFMLIATSMVPAFAQTSGFTIDSVDDSDYPDVALTVSVENQLLEDTEPVFRVIEEGEVREVTVAATTSDDLKVVLLLDVSGSMRGAPLSGAKAAAAQFVELMPGGVEVAIVPFGSSPTLGSEFTRNKQSLFAAIDSLSAQGETALYDGIAAAAALLQGEAEAGRTIILLSDGADTVSSRSLSDALDELESLGSAFYAVELQSPENDRVALDALASTSGGSVISADDPAALTTTFEEIASELLSSYRLVYTSESFNVATLNVLVLVQGAVIAARTQVIELPANPGLGTPDPPPSATPDPEPIPAPRPGTFIELTWLQQSTARWLGIAAIFVALVTTLTVLALQPRSPRPAKRGKSTLNITPDQRSLTRKRTALTVIAEGATSLATQTLDRGDRFDRVNFALERAGVSLRPGEFFVMATSAALAAAAIGIVFFNALVALALAAVVALFIPMWLSSRARERSSLFNEQLGDTLQLLAASLRAGYGLLQAVDAVAEEAPAPTSEEFARIKIETHLGRDMNDALRAAAARVDSEDFRWVAEAIEIHREIGGDLAEILDAVNETIRDRNRIRRRIKSLSAEGRISAIILSVIPIALAIIITFINPRYIGELPQTGAGQVLIVVGIVAWVIAVFWMRRIVRLIF